MWIKATQASVGANGTIITVNSGESLSAVQPGDAAILGTNPPVEVLRSQQATGGAWQLVLEEAWPYTAVTNGRLRVQPNGGRFEAAIQAMRDVNTYAANSHAAMNAWLTSTAATISVEKADGSSVSIPTLHSYTSNWGTAALRDVGTAMNNLAQFTSFGISGSGLAGKSALLYPVDTDLLSGDGSTGFYRYAAGAINTPSASDGHIIAIWRSTLSALLVAIDDYGDVYTRTLVTGNWSPTWVKCRNSRNTTEDSNGFIKAASPIIKLFADSIETNTLAAEQQPQFIKNGLGDYTITGTSGFAQEGWYINMPTNANNIVKCNVEYEDIEQQDGTFNINIKTFEPRYKLDENGEFVSIGAPCDIPDGRWIDIRLNELPAPEIEEPQPTNNE